MREFNSFEEARKKVEHTSEEIFRVKGIKYRWEELIDSDKKPYYEMKEVK